MANLTNSAKLIQEMAKKANRTELPEVNNSTVNFTVNGNTGSQSMTTNQASNSTVNLTVDKTTVGLGNVDNTSDANKPISTATQAALDLKADKSDLSSVYKYKGSVASYSNLPSTGLTAGDVYNVEDTGMNYAWTGSAWDQLGATVDLSNYVDKSTNQTIGGTKTFSTSPVVPSKTTAATNTGTAVATEAQVYLKANDSDVVKLTGNQTIAGTKTFSTSPVVPSKTSAATNSGTKIATEAQVYSKANSSDVLTKTNTTSYTPSADYHPATKKYVDDNAGTEYNAGEGISIGDVSINGRKGPSPDGFHVPSIAEWQGVKTIMDGLSLTTGDSWRINLHIPFAGGRNNSDASIVDQGRTSICLSSSPDGSYRALSMYLYSSDVNANASSKRAYGYSVRCFKDLYVTPDSNWTVVQGTLGSAGIFWNQSKGLISITNGTTGYTMMDKNLGATTVYNDGDTLSEANCGKYYQWGNNYGFAWTGSVTTSSTQVDASNYGPNTANGYYNSDTFITGNNDWSSVQNDNLWGNTTGTITQDNVISNTGVLSVNGETGNVTVASPDMSNYLAKDNTTAFTPTGDYNPATKKYVDDGLSGKQPTLESGTNIKTVNSNSLLGSGNINISEVPSGGNNGDVLTNVSGTPTWQAPSGGYSTITVTLTSAGWSSNTQTVSATGVTASNTVIVSPAPSDIQNYVDGGVYGYSQGSGTLTFKCSTTPSSDISVNVVIMN